METWEVWYPKAAATGMLLGRGRLDPTDNLLLHAAPTVITVEVRADNGNRLAFGKNLEATDESPICLLQRRGDKIVRRDLWPEELHLGLPVLLPGGEVGILLSWWNANDRQEWRWQVEFYNSIR